MDKIQIEPTNRCNAKCTFCRRSYWHRTQGDMSMEQYVSILDKVDDVGKVHLQGQGEPLLNRDLIRMIEETRRRGISIGLNTNATLLTEAQSLRILESGVNRLNFSVDTLDSVVFNENRPGPPLDLVLKNIGHVTEARAKGDFTETSLAIAVVAMSSTIRGLPAVVEYASDIGLDLVYVQNVNSDFKQYGKLIDGGMTIDTASEFQACFNVAQEVAQTKGIELLLPSLADRGSAVRCGWPMKACNITWDGYVSLCCLQPDPEILSFGNIFEDDFSLIWNSVSYEEFRQQFLEGSAEVCISCPALRGNMWHDSIRV